jgi:hypothetical protein
MNGAVTIAAGLAVVLSSIAISGCSGSLHAPASSHVQLNKGLPSTNDKRTPITQPYCWPLSGCARVTGRVQECGGPQGRCHVVGFIQVSLLDSRGRLVMAEHSGASGSLLRHFKMLYPGSGAYTLETKLIGERATRVVRLRRGHTLDVNLVIPIR